MHNWEIPTSSGNGASISWQCQLAPDQEIASLLRSWQFQTSAGNDVSPGNGSWSLTRRWRVSCTADKFSYLQKNGASPGDARWSLPRRWLVSCIVSKVCLQDMASLQAMPAEACPGDGESNAHMTSSSISSVAGLYFAGA